MKYQKLAASIASLVDELHTQGPLAMLNVARAIPLATAAGAASPLVDVFLRCKDKADLSTVAGVEVHQATGKVRTARVALDQIEALTEHAGVSRISAARRLRPLDLASAKVQLPAFRSANPERTGKDVVVGIVDSGIDAAHPAFAGRIRSIWDQSITGPGWGTTNYGTVLTGAAMAASNDTNGHGTHVAGIASGQHSTFGGVAPAAHLVVVKTTFDNTAIADGVRYVFEEADKLGLPAVANLSLGGHFDAHDGSDDLSAALDLLTGAGKIVVAAAGNEGHDPIHAQVRVPAHKKVEILFKTVPSTSPGAPPWVVLNGWYKGTASCQIGIRTSGGNSTPLQPIIATGNPARNYTFPTARLRLTTSPASVTPNGDVQFVAEIFPGAFNTRVQGGTWRLLIKNPGNTAVVVHVWSIVDANSQSAAFQSPAESDSLKVGSPGSAASVVTVAAYTTRNTWVDSSGTPRGVGLTLDDIADFSSPGPLRDGAKKPDLTAPGAMIVSCLSSKTSPPPRPSSVIGPGLLVEAGTSMACPFVAGLVALLLQGKPTLTPAQVKAKLAAACAILGAGAGAFDAKWGRGLIDASKL